MITLLRDKDTITTEWEPSNLPSFLKAFCAQSSNIIYLKLYGISPRMDNLYFKLSINFCDICLIELLIMVYFLFLRKRFDPKVFLSS